MTENTQHHYVHTGRGGAGNIADEDPKTVLGSLTAGEAPPRRSLNASRPSEVSSGRGGAGNMVDSEHIRPEIDEPIPEQTTFHTGRGGEGNVHIDKYGGHSKPQKVVESEEHHHGEKKEGLLEKAKHVIGLDKEKK